MGTLTRDTRQHHVRLDLPPSRPRLRGAVRRAGGHALPAHRAGTADCALVDWPGTASRFLREVVFQSKVIAEKPLVGVGARPRLLGLRAPSPATRPPSSCAASASSTSPHTTAFRLYALALVPFAAGVLAGIVFLLVRRVVFRPEALGPLSGESVLIGAFIATLMITFLLDFRLPDGSTGAQVNWWVHALVILCFLVLIPDSKHFHLVLSPVTVFLKSPVLGDVRNLDFEKEEVGLETVKDLEKKHVLDAFTCVECGRCQMNCPAYRTGKLAQPEEADSPERGRAARRARSTRSWSTSTTRTCCGSARRAGRARTSARSASSTCRSSSAPAAAWSSNGEAPEALGAHVQPARAPRQHLGPAGRPAPEVRDRGGPRDLRRGAARVPDVARVRRVVRRGLPEVAALAVRHPAGPRRHLRRAGEGAVHRGSRPSAPATSTCSRSWRTRTSRSSGRRA